MSTIVNYFHPKTNLNYLEKLKTVFFIRICLIGIVLANAFLISDIILKNENILISSLSVICISLLCILSLFAVKKKGLKFAGNIFCFTVVLFLLIFINIITTDVPVLYKFIQGFYSIFAFLIIGFLFASRTVIFISVLLTIITTTRVYIIALANQPEYASLFNTAYINHTIIVIIVGVIIYYANKLTHAAIEQANKEIKVRELKNQELLATEEEIRASNEELVATTDALAETNNELTQAIYKAEESDRLKTEFLNNMSHEVRTPMNGIIGFSQLLDIPELDNNTKSKYINIIQDSGQQLLATIDNIIEISKLGAEQIVVSENDVNINSLLHELFAIFKIQTEKKNIKLTLNTDLTDKESNVLLDKMKLYKILSNLLENALKFTLKGYIEFGYQLKESDNKTDISNKNICFYVKDSGIGIHKEKHETIFNKFSQAEPTLSRQYGGLGLGLSIAKENTDLLKGKISLDSEKGKGSTFTVTIPYKPIL